MSASEDEHAHILDDSEASDPKTMEQAEDQPKAADEQVDASQQAEDHPKAADEQVDASQQEELAPIKFQRRRADRYD